jgi:hypothetical protein
MAVVDLKVPKRTKRGLPLDQASGTARFFGRMVREIESDLGGHRMLSRIQRELLHAFAGAATQIQYLNGRRIVPVRTRSIIRATPRDDHVSAVCGALRLVGRIKAVQELAWVAPFVVSKTSGIISSPVPADKLDTTQAFYNWGGWGGPFGPGGREW